MESNSDDKIKVSIVCNTYNHEAYIRKALEGFIMQKTNFAYEVLIHDDASTDGTANIIREFEEKYPDIIKPIYQSENQYSKGVGIGKTYQYPRAQGKYVAVCEGDDYWIDEYKLQKQYDALEAHPEVDICAHGAYKLVNSELKDYIQSKEDTIFTFNDVLIGGGGFVATASLMYRAELNNDIPPFRQLLSFDYTLQMHGALRGGMLYLSDIMSVYRCSVPGSWTATMRVDNLKYLKHIMKIRDMINQLNIDTEHKYEAAINDKLLWLNHEIYQLGFYICYSEISNNKYKSIYKKMSFKQRIKAKLYITCPGLVTKIRTRKAKSTNRS